jgi:spoIIIJ-associated protein
LNNKEKTVDDAIQKALEQLGTSREQVSVEILEEGSRGFFGFMGSKPARVRVSVHAESTYSAIKEELQAEEARYQEPARQAEPERQEEQRDSRENREQQVKPQYSEESLQQITTLAKEALQVIMKQLQVEYSVEVKRRDDQILLNIHCENENFLIGRRGTTLDAIQYLVNRIANKNAQEKIQVVLDTSDYRVNRKQRLQRLALRLSRRVKMTGKTVTVAPMNPMIDAHSSDLARRSRGQNLVEAQDLCAELLSLQVAIPDGIGKNNDCFFF